MLWKYQYEHRRYHQYWVLMGQNTSPCSDAAITGVRHANTDSPIYSREPFKVLAGGRERAFKLSALTVDGDAVSEHSGDFYYRT